jgi:hypothetical protein
MWTFHRRRTVRLIARANEERVPPQSPASGTSEPEVPVRGVERVRHEVGSQLLDQSSLHD